MLWDVAPHHNAHTTHSSLTATSHLATLQAAPHHAGDPAHFFLLLGVTSGFSPPDVYAVGGAIFVVGIVVAALAGRRSGRRALAQRLTALGSRLGLEAPVDDSNIETALSYLEQVTGAATEAVAETSADAIRLRRSLDTLSQGVVLCDENGAVVYRNARANALMTSRHGEALAAQAVTELLEDAWDSGAAERTLDLYGPPRRTLSVRARLIDDGRRPLGVIAMIEDISERRRLEEIRRDFVANVSHELKTPMGAIGLLAETLVAEPDFDVARRLATRIHTEAFRVSRIIDDLLDLTRIESEEAPPREPVLVNLVMAEAAERVRASAEQRRIAIELTEPDPPVAVLGDRRQLVSAMHALIENAVTYSYEGSTVTVAGTLGAASLPTGDARTPAASTPSTMPAAVVAGGLLPVASTHPGPHGSANTVAGADSEAAMAAAERAEGSVALRDGGAPAMVATAGETVAAVGVRGLGAADTNGRAPAAVSLQSEPPRAETVGDQAAARSAKEMVRISVVDHGVGIPARDLDRIFERFYRVDHGRSRETGGTGLGLSIVRHVASNHQGWVEVESREGEGSTFTLVLPLQPDRPS